MEKIISCALILILTLFGVETGAISCNILKSSSSDGSSSLFQIEQTIVFPKISFNDTEDTIAIALEGTNSKAILRDHTVIPSYVKVLKFPCGTNIELIECIPGGIHYKVLTKDLTTYPNPYRGMNVSNEEHKTYNDSVGSNEWFEYTIGMGLDGAKRCVFVKLTIFPVKYYPIRKIVHWIESATIQVNYYSSMEELSLVNNYSFIVITPQEFSNELTPLIDHKTNMGFPTNLITLNDIYDGTYFPVNGRDDQEKIKYFIKNAIEQWGSYYVLFVGGSKIFPVRVTQNEHPVKGGDTFVCDLYYADIYDGDGNFCSWDTNHNNLFGEFKPGQSDPTDEVDLFPDVYLGRLACINEEEVRICVNKIIQYETSRSFESDWFSNIALIGGDTAIKTDSDPDHIYEGEYITETIFRQLEGFNPIRLWVSNGELKSIFPTGNKKINKAIESGCGFSLFSGHGYDDAWGVHPHEINWMLPFPYGYWIYHIYKQRNLDRLTIVVSDACKNGNFNCTYRDDCWLWAFIANPHGGAVAGFGNTGTVHLFGGTYCIEGLNGNIHLKTMIAYQENVSTIGEMWAFGINNYQFDTKNPSFLRHYDYRDIEMWHLLGDPSLMIKSRCY